MPQKKKYIYFSTPAEKKATLDQYLQYFNMSKLFFNRYSKNEIYDVTDIPETNEFHKVAKDTAAELGIAWVGMSHTDSNRVMLAMLEDSYNKIKEIEAADNVIMEVNIKVTNNEKAVH